MNKGLSAAKELLNLIHGLINAKGKITKSKELARNL